MKPGRERENASAGKRNGKRENVRKKMLARWLVFWLRIVFARLPCRDVERKRGRRESEEEVKRTEGKKVGGHVGRV